MPDHRQDLDAQTAQLAQELRRLTAACGGPELPEATAIATELVHSGWRGPSSARAEALARGAIVLERKEWRGFWRDMDELTDAARAALPLLAEHDCGYDLPSGRAGPHAKCACVGVAKALRSLIETPRTTGWFSVMSRAAGTGRGGGSA